MAHLKQHREVTLLRITQQREARGGHLMLLMSKLGARVSSGLQKGIWKAFSFFVFSLKGANDEIPVVPSC